MASTEMARWNNHKFTVSSSLIRSFSGLQIKGSAETKSKTSKNQEYVKRKKGKPTEISMTAYLYASTGCNVRDEALKFVDEARSGASDYMYIGNKKPVSYKLMLTDANVKNVEISPKGTWLVADVQLTFKQSSSSGSKKKTKKKSKKKKSSSKKNTSTYSSNKVSVNTSSTTKSKSSGNIANIINNVAKVVAPKKKASSVILGVAKVASTSASRSSSVKSANGTISRILSAAKNYSITKK